MSQHILVVDDDHNDNQRYCELLRGEGYQVDSVSDAEQALATVAKRPFAVVLLDMLLPIRRQGRLDFGGVEVLRQIKARYPYTQVIAVTGYGSRELAAEAMLAGAFDYITKDLDTDDRLPGSVRVAASRAQLLQAQSGQMGSEDSESTIVTPEQMVADSEAMRRLLRRARRLATINSPLLITGEAGVGKLMVANVVHLNSAVAGGPFVVVPCDQLSDDLSELWGDHQLPGTGHCSEAGGGTLVLRNINTLTISQQRELVPLIEHQQYRQRGAPGTTQANCRLIATTSADLALLVRRGRFWSELYEALSMARLEVPPLRERRDKDDILAIAGHLLRRDRLASGIAVDAAELLMRHDYTKGNITELCEILNLGSRASRGGTIKAAHLPHPLDGSPRYEPKAPADSTSVTISFIAGPPTILLWSADEIGRRRSKLRQPYRRADQELMLRALEAAQHTSPENQSAFTFEEQQRLKYLKLWDGDGLLSDIDRRVGQTLYAAISADPDAGKALDSLRNSATYTGKGLALILRFPPKAVALAALPWELLWDDRQALLFSNGALGSCIRYIDLPMALPPQTVVGRRLHALMVRPGEALGGKPEAGRDLPTLRYLKDQGLLTVEELRPATRRELTDRLQEGGPVDILHFSGSALWKGQRAYLQLDDGVIGAAQLAAIVGAIPLVVLQSAHSGAVGANDLFAGIAPMLSAEGVTAVVAMQLSADAIAFDRFAEVMYRNLARGETLQAAVALARQALYIEHPNAWYVPVVYIRSRDLSPLVLARP